MGAFFIPAIICTFAKNNIMKKVLAVIALGAVFFACSTSTDGFTINGEISGAMADSTKIFLKTTDSTNRLIDLDTTNIIDGKFKFTGSSGPLALHYIIVEGIRANVPVILEDGTINLKAQKDSLSFAQVVGTPQNDMLEEYLSEQRRIGEMAQSMQKDMQVANQAKDTATMNSLREEFFELQEKAKDFSKEYIKNNPNALISVAVLENSFRRKALPTAEVQELFDGLTKEIKASKSGKRLADELEKISKTEIGAIAPTFSGPTPDGSTLALHEVKGKLTLIDFWAAWCKPCRQENPNIVSVYNKYKDKGLNVVGVSLDRKSEDWLKAIEDDGLAWNHISNLEYFNDPIAKEYGINAIPAAFLLDENGVIIAKDLRGPALEQKVAELLLN